VHDLTVEEIISYIRNNNLAPGSRLPSERELAEQLKVSRNTIREAYLSLAARGILSIERGRGTFVASPIDEVKIYPLVPAAADIESIIHLLEVRQVLEGGAIPLAMQRATAADYQKLKNLIAAEENCPVYRNGNIAPSVAFENEIVNITGNPSLISLEKTVTEAWINLWVNLGLGVLNPKARTMDHYEILEAMASGDVRLAQKCLHTHLSSVLLVLKHSAP